MKAKNENIMFRNKLLKGLELTYKKMIQFKKEKNSVLVIMKGDKIVKIKPEDAM